MLNTYPGVVFCGIPLQYSQPGTLPVCTTHHGALCWLGLLYKDYVLVLQILALNKADGKELTIQLETKLLLYPEGGVTGRT
jgi:hypothetical protein